MAEMMSKEKMAETIKEEKPVAVLPAASLHNNFDRVGDWKIFSAHMTEYLEIPTKKYGGELAFNDLLHYTGLRVICWNLLKYTLRIWLGAGKRHDFEKTAHYAQMAWTLSKDQNRSAPWFQQDCEGDYIVVRGLFSKISEKLKNRRADDGSKRDHT